MKSTDPIVPNAPDFEQGDNDAIEGEGGNFLRNIWFMVLERKWLAIAVFLVTVFTVAVLTFMAKPFYESEVTIQVLKRGAQVMHVADVVENSITSDTDFNTQIRVMDSLAIVQSVADRLSPEETKQLIEPFKSGSNAPTPVEIIYRYKKVIPQRYTLITVIRYRHPNAKMAARIANLLGSEYIAYNSRLRMEESMKAVDDLRDRAEQQRKRVEEIANALQAFRQKGNMISLVQSKDIVTERLKALNAMATQSSKNLKDAEVRWSMVQDYSKRGRDLTELPFIANQAKVSQLVLQVTNQRMNLSQLRERYKDKHPKLIEAANAVDQGEAELKQAITTAALSIKAEYEDAAASDASAKKALAEQEARSFDLDKAAVEYENLDREFKINEQLLESMIARIRETSVSTSIETDTARVIDKAVESGYPVTPRIVSNMVLGVLGGLVLGVGIAYLVGLIDDRVKTIFDVEQLVRLPLLAVIPRIEKLEQPDKAQLVANGADRVGVEAFQSLYSMLRISEESRNAKFILVTGTIPGEGKSFVATNLALTYARQGQRTIIIDCDLRKPNIQHSFRLRNATKGLVDHCVHGVELDQVICKNVHANLDVLPVGERALNPIRLLNSPEFEAMLADLGRRYDRVVVDTPPIGVVSDVLNILPLMDGAIYSIRFNAAKRAAVRRCVRRLRAANVRVFGAVLNDMVGGAAGEYYGQSDQKMIKEYSQPEPEREQVVEKS